MPTRSRTRTVQPWVKTAYQGIAGLWMGIGFIEMYRGIDPFGSGGKLSFIMGAFTTLIGLGLLRNDERARGVVNILCFVRIVFGVITLGMVFTSPQAMEAAGTGGIALGVLNVLIAGFMIYLVAETDPRAPNL